MTDRHAGSFPRSSGVSDPGPGARSPALRETPLLRATGDGGGTPVTGGTISIHLDSRLGDDALASGPGEADGMAGGTGDETCGVGTAAAADGHPPSRATC